MKRTFLTLISALCFTVFGQTQVVDTFSNCHSDKHSNLPCGWGPPRSWNDVGMYSLEQENGNYYVKVKTEGGVTTIGRPFPFKLSEYPLLSWSWRMHTLPKGADERVKKLGDSGAAVYVIFQGKLMRNRILKYVWSTSLQMGTLTESPYNSRAKIIVLRSGEQDKGGWVQETVNLVEDYKRLFGGTPPAVEGIAILSDGDNTNSLVEADYDDFQVSR